MRKQIGLRMKDETRDQLEKVRGGLSRTDYIEGAVLAQIARDLKKVETPHEYSLDDGKAVQRVDMVEDGPAGPMFVWLCDLCGQPLNQWEKCNSGIHVGPNETGSQGTPVKSTILAALLRQSKVSEGELQDGSPFQKAAVMTGYPLDANEQIVVDKGMERIEREAAEKAKLPNGFAVRSSAESRAGVVPVPKRAQKGRK